MLTNPKFWVTVVVAAVVVPYLLIRVLALTGKKPEREGVLAALPPCSDAPNCVCSEDEPESHSIPPLGYQGDSVAAWTRLQSVLRDSGGREVRTSENYAWFEFRTPLVRFVDDVECRLDAGRNQIEIRSASRVGHSDLGANRKRVKAIREAFGK